MENGEWRNSIAACFDKFSIRRDVGCTDEQQQAGNRLHSYDSTDDNQCLLHENN